MVDPQVAGTDHEELVREALSSMLKRWSAVPIERPLPYLHAIRRNVVRDHFHDGNLK